MKLSEKDRLDIIELYTNNTTVRDICEKYKLTKSSVYKILRKNNVDIVRVKPTLVDKTFDCLYVNSFIESGVYPNGKKYDVYDCICSCGEHVKKRCHGLKNGRSVCCVKCSHKKIDRIGPRLGHIPSVIKCGIKNRAKNRNLFLDDEINDSFLWDLYLSQKGLCAISGVPIGFGEHSRDATNRTASLDRKDSNIGYTKDNVQWVHKKVNEMKWDSSEKEFIEWCEIIYLNKKA